MIIFRVVAWVCFSVVVSGAASSFSAWSRVSHFPSRWPRVTTPATLQGVYLAGKKMVDSDRSVLKRNGLGCPGYGSASNLMLC
jgi:hypothetical protein